MRPSLAVEVAGTHVDLLAGQALYWPAKRMLCLADAHFGKAAVYRALGQPIPAGTTAENLRRLDELLEQCRAEWLVFLGDFLHAPESHGPAVLAALLRWRERWPALRCTLIIGNHDRRAGPPPPALRFEVIEEPLIVGPFSLQHLPVPLPGRHVIAGHEHPVFLLQGRGRQRLRLACFYSNADMTVLPAFGAFTGGHRIDARRDRRVWVTDGQRIWAVPPADRRMPRM